MATLIRVKGDRLGRLVVMKHGAVPNRESSGHGLGLRAEQGGLNDANRRS
jgi:hypothetical protein